MATHCDRCRTELDVMPRGTFKRLLCGKCDSLEREKVARIVRRIKKKIERRKQP